jgi:hypothetical protein
LPPDIADRVPPALPWPISSLNGAAWVGVEGGS